MKILKYLGIVILVVLGLVFGPTLVMGFGVCAFIGFLIIGGLDALGIAKVQSNDFNSIALASFLLGFFIFVLYIAIAGFPKP